MMLRRKIIASSLLLAVGLGVAVAWLAWISVEQARLAERNAATVRASTVLAVRLGTAAHEESLRVAEILIPLHEATAARIAAAGAEVDGLAASVATLPVADAIEESWSEYMATRATLHAIRDQVIAAARSGDASALGLALDKWHLVSARADALLRNFTGYHLRSVDRTVAELQANRQRAIALAVTGLLLGVALALAFSFALTREVVGPIVAIARTADRVASTGALATVSGADRRDEVGMLARAFNEMTARLVSANATLSDADRRKDEFLAVLSHELRNPLAPIRNSVEILDHADPGSVQARRAKAVIRRQTDHLARLVDDLLDVTRISRGKIQLKREQLDLRDVVRRAAEDHRGLFADRGIAFACDVPPQPVPVDGDRTRLSQVFGNLLHNAAKFTDRGGTVRLSLTTAAGEAIARVRDDGVGIESALLPRVFEPFVQAERSFARSSGGLGLGLPQVKGFVELHGGTVEASSAGVGCGSDFAVRLPVAVALAPAREPAPPEAVRSDARRVLVIDDNADAASSLAALLELLGHQVSVAFDAAAGLVAARRSTPDVVLCDLGLPGMNGYEFARAVRADPQLAGVRLIAVSGYAQAEDRRRSAEAGFDAHLAKPPDPDALARLVAEPSPRPREDIA